MQEIGRTYLLIADETEEGAAAARWLGEALHADKGSRVVVLHVFVPAGQYGEPLPNGEWTEPVDVAMENRARAAFSNVLPALELAAERVRTVSRIGRTVEEIVAAAREEAADAIVLGQSGGSPWRHVFRPTLAERLEREAPCPVVTISPAIAA